MISLESKKHVRSGAFMSPIPPTTQNVEQKDSIHHFQKDFDRIITLTLEDTSQ